MNIFKKLLLHYKYKKKIFAKLGENVDYKQFNSKFLKTKNISIGNNCKILDYAYIDGEGKIDIGNCTIIAPHCTILTVNHNYDEKDVEYLPFDNVNILKPVSIGNYCWIGRNVTILPGVTIGDACVIAAGSVVVKDVEPYSIIGGNPAKVIKYRDKELTDKFIKENLCWSDKKINVNNKKIFKEEKQ